MTAIRQNYIVSRLHVLRRFSSTTTIVTKEDLPSTAYKPEIVENDKYEKWEKGGLFRANAARVKSSFSMVLPPPNVTGSLHLGHALACTIQDVIVRRKRSMGHNVLWLPGTDHAGIATQGVVEKYLKSTENVTRHDLGRDKFVEEVWKWREKHGDTICEQLRTLGCSLDWSRQKFTMDPAHCLAVNAAFIRLFQRGLISRRKALVNWSQALKSTVSDMEVDTVTVKEPTELMLPSQPSPVKFGLLYHFAYRVVDCVEELVVATTRPETMLGDVAVAVHPDDERYKHLKGQYVHHPFRSKPIPIIFDKFVDMNMGTGAVKITPAHSKTDYEIAKKHNLPLLQVISEDGVMINAGTFDGLNKYDCRKLLVEKLEELGYMREVKPHEMTLPICSRSGDVIDQLPKEQWFLSCSALNKEAENTVREGQLKILPEKFVSNWLNWSGDDRDWCISRQLWWGHQIPAYKCSVGKEFVWVAATDENDAKLQASKFLRTVPGDIKAERDTDVLDTWFSSGIYPFAALGWPENTPDLKNYYPLSLMATGHDILGFWVHRMVLLGLELTGQLPFDKILLHGIICDNQGAKMSKSKGNVIDPIDVIYGISLEQLKEKSQAMFQSGILSKEELGKALTYHKSNFSNTNGIPDCGVDALRFTLLSQDIKSHFVNFDVAICYSNKLFCNKIWQSIKYTQLSYSKLNKTSEDITKNDLTFFDKWILSRLADMVGKVNVNMDNYDFHLATKALRTFIYNEVCDVYLEATKPGFDDNNGKVGYAHAHTLSAVLNTALRCLAPYMIYLTEEVIPKIPSFETNIIHNFNDEKNCYFQFPLSQDFECWRDKNIENKVEKVLSCVDLIREMKGLYNISNKLRPNVQITSKDDDFLKDVEVNKHIILNLTRCRGLQYGNRYVSCVLDNQTEVSLEIIGDDADKSILAARNKLQKKIKKLEDVVTKLEAKLSSNKYLESSTECKQLNEIERMLAKRKELEQLQRLI